MKCPGTMEVGRVLFILSVVVPRRDVVATTSTVGS